MDEFDQQQTQSFGEEPMEEGLVPLFTLSPDGDAPPRGIAPAAESFDDKRATFQKHHTFGYDVRLDDDYNPGFNAGGGWNAEDHHTMKTDRPRKMTAIGITIAFVCVAGGVMLASPGARNAVGSIGSRFFGGSDNSQVAAPAPAPTANVLALPPAPGDTQPTPHADPSASADAVPPGGDDVVPVAPAPSSDPGSVPITPDPGPTPAADPIHLSATFTTTPSGATATTCQSGKTSPTSCRWEITIQAGHALYSKLTWNNTATMQMTLTDAAGNPLFQEANALGAVNATIATPPGHVFITCTVQQGASVSFTLGLADHDF